MVTGNDERPHGRVHRLFLGPEGLRAGWGCLLFLVVVYLLGLLFKLLAKLLVHTPGLVRSAPLPPKLMIPVECSLLAIVLLATFAMARVERRSVRQYGLGAVRVMPRFAGGLAAGFAAISGLVGVLWAAHLLVLSGPALPGAAAVHFGLAWGLGFLFTGLFEELLLRGYLLFTLGRGIGFWWSALLLSAAFGLIHGNNPGETPVGLFSAAAVGLFFCLSIWYTGSLWWAIGFHAAWDWGESFFWGTSDSGTMVQGHLFNEQPVGPRLWSGGATGPEGSLLVFPVLLVCALLVFLWWRGRVRESPRNAQP